MNPIDFLRKANIVLVFVILVAIILVGGYLIVKSRKPMNTIHVSVDSVRLHKK